MTENFNSIVGKMGQEKEVLGQFDYGTTALDHEQIMNTRIILEKAREWKQPLYLCFIDFTKAFDMVQCVKFGFQCVTWTSLDIWCNCYETCTSSSHQQ